MNDGSVSCIDRNVTAVAYDISGLHLINAYSVAYASVSC